MDDKIDNGAILGQVKTYMPDNPTMYNVIKITKRIGGDLMCEVIKKIISEKRIERVEQPSKNIFFVANYS